MNRLVPAITIVIAAIVHWNSTYVAAAVDHLRRQRLDAPPELALPPQRGSVGR